MAKSDLRSAYVPHDRVPADIGGPSMTRQEFADECDVNALMARYDKVGVWPLPPVDKAPMYLDLTEVPDNLLDVMNMMVDAEAAFMSLPAVVRRDFENDPMQFVAFASDPQNLEKMREYGLAPPPAEAPKPMMVEVVNPVVPPAGGGSGATDPVA